MNTCETGYRRVFDAWSAGKRASALELCRDLLRDFPDYTIGRVLHGVILYELARYQEAEQVLREAIRSIPLERLQHGYTHLGHLHRESGHYDEAEKWYRKALELGPDDAGRHIFLGILLAKRGDLSGAEECHRMGTRCSKGCVDEAYLNLGLVLRAQERYTEALECFKNALKLTPDYEDAITGKSDMEMVIGLLHANA
jgi:tetratricopeptide (TPR) repeat protein